MLSEEDNTDGQSKGTTIEQERNNDNIQSRVEGLEKRVQIIEDYINYYRRILLIDPENIVRSDDRTKLDLIEERLKNLEKPKFKFWGANRNKTRKR